MDDDHVDDHVWNLKNRKDAESDSSDETLTFVNEEKTSVHSGE